ncbi:MAG: hypothetical protein LBP68_02925 [Acidobacteriota bacterium]|jgi:HEAT repeat protein|nr:hypothetical protein [Acidobacteriota bacterium]
MGFFRKFFASDDMGPSEGQIRRAVKQVTQLHGEAASRVGAMMRLAEWGTPEAASALLRRFTVQTPQASMDLEEKQYAVKLLAGMGDVAVKPILDYLKTEPDVTFPVQALRRIHSADGFHAALLDVLDTLSAGYSRWPEAKTVLIASLGDDAFPQVGETVFRFLGDDDDDVCIAAVDYLARNGDDATREKLIQVYLAAEGRPRVRGSILDRFCEKEWGVRGYQKEVNSVIAPPFYLTSKGVVKRRGRE